MTDTPDIKAQVASAKAAADIIDRHPSEVVYGALLYRELADALERQQAVVEAASARVENCLKCEDGVIGEYVGCDDAGLPTLVPQPCPDCADLRTPLAALTPHRK